MNITFKNITRVFFVSALSVLALSSCSKWTEPEPVKYEYLTLEQKNPELYKAYMESLREYRDSEHKVLIAKFDNSAATPSGRAEHINCVPDSTDYVVLTNPTEISSQLLSDMKDLQVNKRTKVLGQISIADILKDYKAYREKWLEDHAPKPELAQAPVEEEVTPEEPDAPVDVMLDFDGFIKEKMPVLLEPFEKYPYDGINLIFNGKNPESLNAENLEIAKAEQSAFFTPVIEWLNKDENRLFFLEGDAHYIVIDEKPSLMADFILVPAQSAMVPSEFTHVVNKMIIEKNVPSDKIIVVVTTISINDPTIKEGHFSVLKPDGSEMTAIEGAAYWANGSFDSFIPRGIAVEHAQNDYYDLKKVYSETRSAISIMNPSPIK